MALYYRNTLLARLFVEDGALLLRALPSTWAASRRGCFASSLQSLSEPPLSLLSVKGRDQVEVRT